MRRMRERSWFPSLCFCLAAMIAVFASMPAHGIAGVVASRGSDGANLREQDLERIRALLERKIVQQRLRDYGVSPREAMEKIRQLDDPQLHRLAVKVDGVAEGGTMVGAGSDLILALGLIFAVIAVVAYLVYLGVKVAVNEIRNRPSAEDTSLPPTSVPAPGK